MEYERWLMHRNYRINLVNLAPDFSDITYTKSETSDTRRTIDYMFQGIKMSDTLLGFFSNLLGGMAGVEDVYSPVLNANDFSAEISLVPNTHTNFREVFTRAYYDRQYLDYRALMESFNISNIATFALVDPSKDKNHTGWFLVKVQRKVSDHQYTYIVVKMDKDGRFDNEFGVRRWTSSKNEILSVCERDFLKRGDEHVGEVGDVLEGEIPMVHSTTSSHYSVFRQRIPNYDLKQVRHYLQFKNRLAGMELCLQQLKRDVHHKEVRVSECFMKQTMVLSRVMNEFTKNGEVLELVGRFYDLQNEWDGLTMSMAQIESMRDERVAELEHLQLDYQMLENSELDKKLALGQKIASLRLELDKGIVEKLTKIRDRKIEIVREMNLVNERIRFIIAEFHKKYEIPDEDADKIEDELSDGNIEILQEQINHLAQQLKQKYQVESSDSSLLDGVVQLEELVADSSDGEFQYADSSESHIDPYTPPILTALDTDALKKYIHQSERWRNYTFSIGWELKSMKEMLVKCDDATIKVRRLVHNFEERMERTRNDVWDGHYNLKPDFNFKDISVAAI